jgi:hypothetical protein
LRNGLRRGAVSTSTGLTWPGSEESNLLPDVGRLGGHGREFGDMGFIEKLNVGTPVTRRFFQERESESVESYGSKSSVYSDSLPDSLRRILPNWMTLGILR